MKKAYFQNILSIIKKNKVTYIAIMMFVFFSMHMYLFSSYMIEDLYSSVDGCYDFYKKYDVAVYVKNGISDGIKEELLSIEGTDDVETAHISYGNINTKNGKLDTEVRTLTEKFALPIDVDGKLPIKTNEIALLKHFAENNNIKIGDSITLENDPYLQEESFVVTALFDSSQFLRKMECSYGLSKTTGNTISCLAFVNYNALNNNYIDDNYIMMKNNSINGLSKFSKEYYNLCNKYIDTIDDTMDILENGNYFIERWDEEIGYIMIDIFTHTTKTIHKTLVPVLFLVAVAVLIISISRMILDQKNEIAIMKANGFTDREIALNFYVYSISATIFGSILANIVATFIIEKIAIKYTSTIITLKMQPLVCNIKEVLLTILVPIIIIFITTYICTKNILSKEALDILNEKKVTTIKTYFYEFMMVFKKLPIFIQMIINNMLKDTKRCIGVILGIIGSVMLLTSGIVINRNVYNGYSYQMRHDILFDTVLFFNPIGSAKDEIERILVDNKVDYALCQYTDLLLKDKNNKTDLFALFVYDNKDDFSKLFKFNTWEKKNHKYDGLFLQESYKKNFDLDEHGYIKVKNLKGDYKYIRTAQYFYNYIEVITLAAIDKETYEDVMDDESYMQSFIIDSTKAPMDLIYKELSDVDGYLYSMDYKKHLKEGFMMTYNFINIVVGIFIITSIFFSFLIVLNLMKVNIIERKNELIILLVNGFTKKEIKDYVLADMILMLVIGNIFGVIIGVFVGIFVLSNFNNVLLSYSTKINYKAILISMFMSIAICTIITRLSIKEVEVLDVNDR